METGDEYKAIFLAEAEQQHAELEALFLQLEAQPGRKDLWAPIFRLMHTLKGNAMGLGYVGIASLSHLLEDYFKALQAGVFPLWPEDIALFLRAGDLLADLIRAIRADEEIAYKGFTTKLKVALRKAKKRASSVEKTEVLKEVAEAKEPLVAPREIRFSNHLRVPVERLTQLLNLVGELSIEKDRLMLEEQQKKGNDYRFLTLHRLSTELQYQIMQLRMAELQVLFAKYPRILSDLCRQTGKKARLEIKGGQTEIDRNLLPIIADALQHLLRNAMSHGIETPEKRRLLGKDEVGTLQLRAGTNKDQVLIELQDDGAGVDRKKIEQKLLELGWLTAAQLAELSDEECFEYLFKPGFSSADQLTDLAGRGVGLDAVRSSVQRLGGQLTLSTTLGKGSLFCLQMPYSMAMRTVLLFEQASQTFALPIDMADLVLRLKKKDLELVGNRWMCNYNGVLYPIRSLADVFGQKRYKLEALEAEQELQLLLLHYAGQKMALWVDRLQQQKEIFERKLAPPLDQHPLFRRAAILGNGEVCLLLTIDTLFEDFKRERDE